MSRQESGRLQQLRTELERVKTSRDKLSDRLKQVPDYERPVVQAGLGEIDIEIKRLSQEIRSHGGF